MRGVLAVMLVSILGAVVVFTYGGFAFDWTTEEEARDLVALLVTPVVGLVGAVVGFYFGSGGIGGSTGGES